MRLYEYEGKALLAGHGVSVPVGGLWPDLPDFGPGQLVVKAQILAGQRGKLGGIRFIPGREACQSAVETLLGTRLGDHLVGRVVVEERLDIERELYLAVIASRDSRSPVLLASRRGGVDVEDVPERDMLRLPIDPLLGLRPAAVRYVAHWLGFGGEAAVATIRGVYETFHSSDAELVEVNPLALTRDGRLVAADAKVLLDDAAAFRHRDWPAERGAGTSFERACAAHGTVGVEVDPDGAVAIVVSGAGLMMATIDLLGARGIRLRAAVDLTGMAFGTPAQLAEVFRLVAGLAPRVILVNAFFNLALCDQLAGGIAAGLDRATLRGRLVVRLRGRNLAEARAVLAPLHVPLFEDLSDAIDGVAGLVREVGPSPS